MRHVVERLSADGHRGMVTFDNRMLERSLSVPSRPAVTASAVAYWSLRGGAALCFIGHGAFGFITKAAWVPYFGVVGIPESWAWRLMPLVGAVDVLAGMAVLFAPRALPLVYMTLWATWTALLRPLAGESVFETFERAGNYGVPLALLLLAGIPRSVRGLLDPIAVTHAEGEAGIRVRRVLVWTTGLLLIGHGMLGVSGKPMLVEHYAALGLPAATAVGVGLFELALAAAVIVRPAAAMLVFVAAWKLATESLFISAGAPVWELVERAGSVAAPLALAALCAAPRLSPAMPERASPAPWPFPRFLPRSYVSGASSRTWGRTCRRTRRS
jgi:hypothetical protein